MTIVDAHQHFWDPARFGLQKPPPEASVLDRAYLPSDLEPYLRRAGVDYTVLVQGLPQTAETNRWYFALANRTPYIAGVVAWVDLQQPDLVGRQLDELQAEHKFAGIRHIVDLEPDVDWIVQDAVKESLRELARRDIPYDMVVNTTHLANVVRVLDQVPELRIVIDHIAKPDIAHSGSPGWAEGLAEVARSPNVYCKLSGMVTEADWSAWKTSDLKPYVERVIDIFSLDRLMYGSDWPVCLLAADYNRVWAAINDLLSDIGTAGYAKVFGANAARFYGLRLPQ